MIILLFNISTENKIRFKLEKILVKLEIYKVNEYNIKDPMLKEKFEEVLHRVICIDLLSISKELYDGVLELYILNTDK